MSATIEKKVVVRPTGLSEAMLLKSIIGGEGESPAPIETMKMTLLVIHDCVEDGLLKAAHEAAESLVHQIGLMRLNKMADEAGIVRQGN